MKKSIILGVAFVMSQMTFAQNTITGTVVDKKSGDPIPGAKVEVAGRNYSQSVLTNMDGTFSINTPKPDSRLRSTYVGWDTTTKKGADGMVIKMGHGGFFSFHPDHYQWFVGLNVAMPLSKFKCVTPGLTFGRVKNAGWYVKLQWCGYHEPDGKVSSSGSYLSSYGYYNGEQTQKYIAGIAGALIRVYGPIYVNVGAGYSRAVHYLVTDEDKYLECRNCSYWSNVVGDFGVMVRIKKFYVQAGTQGNYSVNNLGHYNTNKDLFFCGTIGAGYTF